MTLVSRKSKSTTDAAAMSDSKQVLVLVGGGHTHIQVVLGLSRAVKSSTTCVLLSDAELAAYSGMLPAAVAGLVKEERAHVNLRELAERNAFRFVHAAVTGIDAERNELRLRPCADPQAPECRMRFDFLSVNVGSRTAAIPDRLATALEDGHAEELDVKSLVPMVIRTRPILELMTSMARFEDEMKRQVLPEGSEVKVVVVGGGAAGIELALAVETRLSRSFAKVSVLLVSKGESFASAFGRQAGTAVRAELKKRNIQFRFGTTALAVNRRAGLLVLDNSPMLQYDLLVVATGAAPHSWLKNATDLAVDESGWLLVEPTLQCKGHSNIFASGDCVSFGRRFGDNFPPKAGVYAVREGPYLTHNIEAAVKHEGNSSFKQFVPQSSFLSLLSTGDGRGIGSKYGLVLKGTWVYRLKSFIDESWQDRFRSPPPKQSASRGRSRDVPPVFDGTPAEGAAILLAAEDIQTDDSFEKQLLVLQRMDADLDFRQQLLEEVKKEP